MGFPEDFLDRIKELPEIIGDFFGSLGDRILRIIPEEKRKPALICAGATIFALIVVFIVSLALRPKAQIVETEIPFLAISSDELFIPAEPDFLPGYLFEYEPKPGWTVDDAEPFWANPAQSGSELWLEEMSAAIDKILENVP